MDRDSGPGPHRRAHLCPRARIAAREQSPVAATHDCAEPGAGAGELPAMRVRALAHVDPFECAADPLLSLHWLGCLAPPRRPALRQPTRATRSLGSDRLDR